MQMLDTNQKKSELIKITIKFPSLNCLLLSVIFPFDGKK
jgi:hypothetical protein